MQRTICGLSRLHHNAVRQCSSASHVTSITEYRNQRYKHFRRPTSPNHLTTIWRNISNLVEPGTQQSTADDDLLSRSRRYNIKTVLDLDRESDFDFRPGQLECLVDTAPLRGDLRLWDVLLDYRIRHYGSNGAATIWRGLKYRGPRVSLNSEDELTTCIWQKLLSCAAEHNDLDLTKRLCEPGGIAWRRPKLFAETISTLLRSSRHFQVGVMCDILKSKHAGGIADVLELYRTFQPQDHDDLRAFCLVYDKLRPGKMYEQGVRHLFGKKRPDEAFLLHKFLISRGDFPTSFHEIEPFMKHLANRSEDPGPFLRSLAASGVVFWGQGRRAHEHESQERMLQAQMRISDYNTGRGKPWANKVSDSFAAKAFSTNALSFDFVLNALCAFGLTEIGPQSIREIGLHASDMESFSRRLAKLDEMGIDTGGSAYSRFIRKTCQAKEYTLLVHALQTDMHHDVFEDPYLQTRLLVHSLNRCAWTQTNLLLAMLNHGHFIELRGSVTSSFLVSIVDDDLRARTFLTLLRNLTTIGARVPATMYHDLVDHLLIRLGNSRRTDQLSRIHYRRRAQFTVGVVQACTIAGARMTVPQWRSLFRHLGRSGALLDVHKLAVWLVMWHSERVEHIAYDKEPEECPTATLRRIFDSSFQRAVVYWALKEQFARKSGRVRQPWQAALLFLKYLQAECAIPIRLWTIRKTIVLYVRGLFRQSMAVAKIQGGDKMHNDSTELCSRLFKMLNELMSNDPLAGKTTRDVASEYLLEQKNLRARETTMKARPTVRKAMRRLPYPRTFMFFSRHKDPERHT